MEEHNNSQVENYVQVFEEINLGVVSPKVAKVDIIG